MVLKLAGIILPEPPLNEAPKDSARLAEETHRFLSALLQGTRLNTLGTPVVDRHEREVAQVVLHKPGNKTRFWLQAKLIEAGHARVSPSDPASSCVGELLKLESKARSARRGLWSSNHYAVREAWQTKRLLKRENTFQLVTGKVRKVAKTKRFTYLNFGKNWRNDFTASIRTSVLKRMVKSGFSVEKLKGKRVRVRGWITYRNGPLIEVTNRHQLELPDKAEP